MNTAPRRTTWRVRAAAAFAAGTLLTLLACAGNHPQSTFTPTTDLGREQSALFHTIFLWALGVFVVVESLLLYTVIRFRSRPGGEPARHMHGHTLLEIGWTLAPAVILVFIAVPTIRTIFRVAGDTVPGALEVQVVGHQWWWEFRYPELGIVTANELHLPQGRPVHLSITSADVIHSFWAPRLGGKRDAIQGRTTHLTFTPDSLGTFMGQCAEFCGQSHARMLLRVVVQDSSGFGAWVGDQTQPPAPPDSLTPLARAGYDAFKKIEGRGPNPCIVCHTIQGISGGIVGPNLTHVASRTVIAGATTPMSAEGISLWLHDPAAVKPGSKMPKVDLTDQEIEALAAYLLTLK